MTNVFAKVPHRHPCNLCIVSLYESGKQCWVQSLPPKCSVIGAGHAPSSNMYVANITILSSITYRPLFIFELAPDQQ